ncbi:hypothetical protein [Cupriavidus pauculus]|uniref:DUF1640 domain-containing protein n=1 Tax=Cupriavidus pauculus TaxID=82633 RepID=A0A2N5CCM4_9BURK|nr:hypothetical protein [Cupriavidus pauculus]PLP99934.1 hypothetical protein CYJ10_12890 [Cupriavidus pauculus]
MSSQAATWGLAPDHGESPQITNVLEFALGLYGQMAHIQREVGALSAAQPGIGERIDATQVLVGAAETRLGAQILDTEARLGDRIRESESRMTRALETSEARGESMIARVLQEIDARSEARFSRMEARFDTIDAKFEIVDAKFDAIDARFDQMDARMDKMDDRFDKVDDRFDKSYARVARLEENLGERIQSTNDRISALKDRLNKVFWVASGGGIVLGLAVGWKPIIERMGGLAGL